MCQKEQIMRVEAKPSGDRQPVGDDLSKRLPDRRPIEDPSQRMANLLPSDNDIFVRLGIGRT